MAEDKYKTLAERRWRERRLNERNLPDWRAFGARADYADYLNSPQHEADKARWAREDAQDDIEETHRRIRDAFSRRGQP